MKTNTILNWVAILITNLALSACGTQKSETDGARRFGKADPSVGSCLNNPFEGEDLTLTKFSNTQVASLYFAKPFYQNQLLSSLQSSSYSIAKKFFLEGVDIYQVPSKASLECRYFDFLEIAPEKSLDSWNEQVQANSVDASLLGLFTTTYTKNTQTLKTRLTRPTILIVDSTQKWTLLHEVSHYLFAKGRIQTHNLQFNTEINKQIEGIDEKITLAEDQLAKNGDAKIAIKVAKLYQKYFNLNHELDRRTALEEFSIESMLLELAAENQIAGINDTNDKSNAIRYMVANSEKVLNSYRNFSFYLKDLAQHFQEKQWSQASKELKKLKAKVDDITDFIDSKLIQAVHLSHSRSALPLREPQPTTIHLHHFDVKQFNKRHELFGRF